MVNASRVWLWVFLCWEDQDLPQISGPRGFQLIEMKHSRSEGDLIANDSKRKKKNLAAIISLLMIEGRLKSAIYGFHSESSSGRSVPTSPELPILSQTFALKIQFLFPEHLRSIKCSPSFCAPRTSFSSLMHVECVRIFCFILKLRWKVNWAEGAISVYYRFIVFIVIFCFCSQTTN